MKSDDFDTIVIGAGPAGSTAAAILAEKGHHVALLEKTKFPRYHVGESLMPFCYFPLERLGLTDQMDEIGFTQKFSVQFVTEDGSQSRPFYFFQHYDHPSSTTWQVLRSQFDELIMDKARENGAEVRELTTVKSFIEESGNIVGVNAISPNSETYQLNAPMVIDASGRDTIAQNKHKWKKRDPELNKIAIWTYYKAAKRDPGLDAGSTTVAYLPGKGWFWYIPLEGDIVSVGIVAEREYLYNDTRDLSDIFAREIKNNLWIDEHLKCGEQFGKYWSTGEYSYRSEFCATNGLLLAGDAYAFLDPVFSSGVFLALKSGEMAADAVSNAITNNDFSAGQFNDYGKELCKGIEAMRALVYAFYDESFSFGDLIKSNPDLKGDLTDCLIGDVFKDFTKLFAAVSDFATVPSKLKHGLVV
ncbi:MAG: NAD(P)/FAD-dependent oxidoreductase [Verrucomicrobiales bacterium]|nr:NAD(P)/FAD-dependent oxidoreductase [Verrucomicrobiales bacterium]